MKKYGIIIIFIFVIAGAAFQNRFYLRKFIQGLPKAVKSIEQGATLSKIKQSISVPPPLKSKDNYEDSYLTRAGVISVTNTQRKENANLSALKENVLLNKAAQIKLRDMFKQQYFEHINPQGVGPADLGKEVNYKFIAIGENLALGNFKNDQGLVEAWMNSPGHRANILNSQYMEIGVAVGKGTYEGREVWLAVQEFGKPSSACPEIESNIKTQIATYSAEAKNIKIQLEALQASMESANPRTKEEYDAYNAQVAEYNGLVHVYNNRVDVLKELVAEYNKQVAEFNECAE